MKQCRKENVTPSSKLDLISSKKSNEGIGVGVSVSGNRSTLGGLIDPYKHGVGSHRDSIDCRL